MATTLGIRRRRARERLGIGMPGDNARIVELARSLRETVDAPVMGGIAVYLHGGAHTTLDLDLYTLDRKFTGGQLEAVGARWESGRREYVLDGIAIHTVTPEETRHAVEKTSIIDGVRVISLKDLIAIKLICGLNRPGRSKDITHVEDLIANVPLDKRFAGKLPRELREPFKRLVDGVRENQKRGTF